MTRRHTCKIRVEEVGGRRGQEKKEKKRRGREMGRCCTHTDMLLVQFL